MPIQLRSSGFTHAAALTAIAAVVVGCSSVQGGAAVRAPSSPAPASASPAITPTPMTASSGPSLTARPASSAAPTSPAPTGSWSAIIETGVGNGIPSPTGDLTAELANGEVCFVPDTGTKNCGELAVGVMPTFAVFAQDGDHLLVVAGPQNAASAYVFDTSSGVAQVLGPQGVQDFAAGSVPPAWDLSSAVWGVDGRSVLLVPRTAEATGPVLSFDLMSGLSTELIRLDAALANSSPSLWTTTTGLAIVPNAGEKNVLWFADFATGAVDGIGDFPEPGGSLVLSSADPLGRTVLVCPKKADGRLGATVGVAVNGSQGGRLLQDSQSCAGSVFSSDGACLALTAQGAEGYLLIVVDMAAGRRVLTVPLPVAEPSAPPYLTWDGDMIVATDVTGDWPVPSLRIQLQH